MIFLFSFFDLLLTQSTNHHFISTLLEMLLNGVSQAYFLTPFADRFPLITSLFMLFKHLPLEWKVTPFALHLLVWAFLLMLAELFSWKRSITTLIDTFNCSLGTLLFTMPLYDGLQKDRLAKLTLFRFELTDLNMLRHLIPRYNFLATLPTTPCHLLWTLFLVDMDSRNWYGFLAILTFDFE